MNIYLLSQIEYTGYDTYDSCVVVANTEAEAKTYDPSGGFIQDKHQYCCDSWPRNPDLVDCLLIGKAIDGVGAGVICASFNAG